MNGDPYRTPQPADRRVINRSGQPYARAEEPPVVKEDASPAPKPAGVRSTSHHAKEPQKKSRKGLLWAGIVALLVVLLALGAWFLFANNRNAATGIDTSRYQAVFLANGQIYFGKLQDFNDKSFKLTNIYYPQAQNNNANEQDSQANTQQSGIKLIRLGDEVHGPESEMFVSKEQILYYENLKADSKVADLIKQNEAN